jgi:hypothetical protein
MIERFYLIDSIVISAAASQESRSAQSKNDLFRKMIKDIKEMDRKTRRRKRD